MRRVFLTTGAHGESRCWNKRLRALCLNASLSQTSTRISRKTAQLLKERRQRRAAGRLGGDGPSPVGGVKKHHEESFSGNTREEGAQQSQCRAQHPVDLTKDKFACGANRGRQENPPEGCRRGGARQRPQPGVREKEGGFPASCRLQEDAPPMGKAKRENPTVNQMDPTRSKKAHWGRIKSHRRSRQCTERGRSL